MDDYKDQFSIVKMSQILGVYRSGYNRWRGRGPSKRELANKEFTQQIRQIWEASGKTYGSPRIHAALLADGEQLSRPRVARLMKKAGIASQIRPKWITTTDSGHALPVAANLLGRNFEVEQLAKTWVSDITYLPSTGALQTSKVTQSMSRKGNCWDNAPAESFFKTLKAELPADTSGCSYGQVRRRVLFNYIKIWYNRKRLHSSLDYQTPAQTEQNLTQQPGAA